MSIEGDTLMGIGYTVVGLGLTIFGSVSDDPYGFMCGLLCTAIGMLWMRIGDGK